MISPEVLRRFPYFNAADGETFRELAMAGEEVAFEPGEFLFKDGTTANRLFLLIEGEVDIQYILRNGERRTVDTRVAGDLLVWSAVVAPFKTTANGVARRPTRAVAIDATTLRELCDRDREMGYGLMMEVVRIVSQRLHAARVQLATVG